MALRPHDISALKSARDATGGTISRSKLIDAFKHAGATISAHGGQLHVMFNGTRSYDIPLGRGDIDFGTPFKTFRATLSELAAELLQRCEAS
jgi:hypothetical protein